MYNIPTPTVIYIKKCGAHHYIIRSVVRDDDGAMSSLRLNWFLNDNMPLTALGNRQVKKFV